MKHLNLRTRLLLSFTILTLITVTTVATASYMRAEMLLTNSFTDQVGQTAELAKRQLGDWCTSVIADAKVHAARLTIRSLLLASKEDAKAFKLATEALNVITKRHNEYETIGVAGTDGILLAASDGALGGKLNIQERDYFKNGLQGKAFVSEVMTSKTTGNPIFMVSEPAKESDRIIGVLEERW